MSAEVQQLATGSNNVAGLLPFNLLSPPLLSIYRRAITQTWSPQLGRKLLGSRLAFKTWGKPSVRFTFGQLTRNDLVYLISLEGAVTIYVLNESINAWGTYNGVWLLAETIESLQKRRKLDAPYSDVPFDVLDLEATT